jgi:hypothetical protein
MDFLTLNATAWDIASLAMVRKGRDVSAYSTSQIRKFFALAQTSDTELSYAIDEAIKTYSPQPAKLVFGTSPVMDAQQIEGQKKKNTLIGERIKSAFSDMDAPARTRFMQYLIWDIKIIEQGFRLYQTDAIPFFRKLFAGEGLQDSTVIISRLESLVSSGDGENHGFGHAPAKNIEKRRSR